MIFGCLYQTPKSRDTRLSLTLGLDMINICPECKSFFSSSSGYSPCCGKKPELNAKPEEYIIHIDDENRPSCGCREFHFKDVKTIPNKID